MAWEFRKLAPGDNVAVEAQRDPFAAPKWAPPVWHMPEGLVLIVNAVRVLARLLVFLVRNIIPVSATVGLCWLGYVYGWAVPVAVVALAGVALGVWALVDYPSLMRWVGVPARSWWRRVWVYRRHWQPERPRRTLRRHHPVLHPIAGVPVPGGHGR